MGYAILLAAVMTQPNIFTEKRMDVLASAMLCRSPSVTRAEAIAMDDLPALRKALKRRAIVEGRMFAYQANRFDDGFSGAFNALNDIRWWNEDWKRQQMGPEFPIRR